MNPPAVEFEFQGTRFPAMQGGRGMEYASAIIPGGKFSLGRLKHGSGYCVGAIVETKMGLKEEKERMAGSSKQGLGSAAASVGSLAGNGMRDVWVIGERFFRGVSGVFDVSYILCPNCGSFFWSLLIFLFFFWVDRYRRRGSGLERIERFFIFFFLLSVVGRSVEWFFFFFCFMQNGYFRFRYCWLPFVLRIPLVSRVLLSDWECPRPPKMGEKFSFSSGMAFSCIFFFFFFGQPGRSH